MTTNRRGRRPIAEPPADVPGQPEDGPAAAGSNGHAGVPAGDAETTEATIEAPDSGAASSAAATYIEKLERAEAAIATTHARVLEAVPEASAGTPAAEG